MATASTFGASVCVGKGDRVEFAAAVRHRHFRTQLVNVQTFFEICGKGERTVEQVAAVARGKDQKIEQNLALGRQQRGVARLVRLERGDVVGHQIMQELARIFARYLDDGAVIEQDRRRHVSLPPPPPAA